MIYSFFGCGLLIGISESLRYAPNGGTGGSTSSRNRDTPLGQSASSLHDALIEMDMAVTSKKKTLKNVPSVATFV